jgi:hypothetical protein
MLLAGCGGGGSNASVAPSGPIGGGGSGTTTPTQILISIPTLVPSSVRRAANVSPATQSFVVTLVSANGVSENASVETDLSGPNCVSASGSSSCTATIDAPTGNDVFTVALYAQPGGTGTLLGSVTAPQTITLNATNRITLDVNGVIGSLFVAIVTPTATTGTPLTSSAYVIALDPSGNIIVLPGGYVTPITVTSGDTTGHVKLAVNGGTPLSSVSLTSPHDLLSVVYDGGGAAQTASITATTPGTSSTISATAPFAVGSGAPPLAFTLTPGAYTTGGHAIAFTASAASETATFTLAGGTPPYTVHSGATSTATVSPASGNATTTYTVTSVAVGATSITVTDSANVSTTIPVSVAAPALTSTVSAGTHGLVAGSTVTLVTGATATVALSGGSGIYSATSSTPSVATVSAGTTSPYTLTAVGAGTSTITLGDTLGDPVGSLTVNVVAPLAVNPNTVAFGAFGSTGAQTVTISGGLAPYLVNGTTSSSSTSLSWTVSGTSITFTASAVLNQIVSVTDALGESEPVTLTATTLTEPIQ